MTTLPSAKWTPSLIVALFSLIAVLTSAVPANAQPVPVANKWPSYNEAIANAKQLRWKNWLSLRDPLLEDRKKLIAQVREKYAVQIKNAGSVARAKALQKEMYVETDKVIAAVQVELNKALATVNDAFCYNVENICQQYGKPIPKWLSRFRTR